MASKNVFILNIEDCGRLSSQDFNNSGFIHPSRHLVFHEQIRNYGLELSLEEDADSVTKLNRFFLRHGQLSIDANITTDMVSQPLCGIFTVTYVGRTSFVCKSQLILKTQQKCISTMIAKGVCVSLETRRPAPLPDKLVQMYAPRVDALGTKPKIEQLETMKSKDQKMYEKTMVVGKEHVDLNGHMNAAVYVKFCVLVAKNSINDKIFGNITHELLECKLTKLTCEYIGETLEGDDVSYTMWQDSQNKYLFHFEAKKDGVPVFRCRLNLDHFVSSL